jgi:hypothetical protein
MRGLTYEIGAFRPSDRHVISVGYDYRKTLFINHWSEAFRPKDAVIEWLDDNTPGWEFFTVKVLVEFWFKTKEDAMLFKLTWA